MSKTSHTSNGALEDHGTLADSDLAAVTGGHTAGGSVGALGYMSHIPMGLPLPPFPPPPRPRQPVCSRPATDGSPDQMEKIMRELRDDELEKVSGGLDAGKNEVAVEGVVSVGDDVSKLGPSNYQKKNVTTIKYTPIVLR